MAKKAATREAAKRKEAERVAREAAEKKEREKREAEEAAENLKKETAEAIHMLIIAKKDERCEQEEAETAEKAR